MVTSRRARVVVDDENPLPHGRPWCHRIAINRRYHTRMLRRRFSATGISAEQRCRQPVRFDLGPADTGHRPPPVPVTLGRVRVHRTGAMLQAVVALVGVAGPVSLLVGPTSGLLAGQRDGEHRAGSDGPASAAPAARIPVHRPTRPSRRRRPDAGGRRCRPRWRPIAVQYDDVVPGAQLTDALRLAPARSRANNTAIA